MNHLLPVDGASQQLQDLKAAKMQTQQVPGMTRTQARSLVRRVRTSRTIVA